MHPGILAVCGKVFPALRSSAKTLLVIGYQI
jgi:hypothetical protein